MKICKFCGQQNADESMKCFQCGADLNTPGPNGMQGQNYGGNGYVQQNGFGVPNGGQPVPGYNYNPPKKSNKTTIIIIVLVVIIVLLGAIIGGMLIMNADKGKEVTLQKQAAEQNLPENNDTKNDIAESDSQSEITENSENTQADEEPKSQAAATNDETDWKSMTMVFDGKTLKFPFNYSEISDTFALNLKDYGYEDGYVMNKGDSVLSVDLESKKYTCDFAAAFINTTGAKCDITEAQVSSISCDIDTYDDDVTYPSIVLPGGITWGATPEQVKAVYGTDEDNLDSEYGDLKKDGYTDLEYYNDFKYKLHLNFDKDKGLTEIEYSIY